jgi:hypothetical protein
MAEAITAALLPAAPRSMAAAPVLGIFLKVPPIFVAVQAGLCVLLGRAMAIEDSAVFIGLQSTPVSR